MTVTITAETLARLGAELGLAAVGAAPVGPYEQTERLIRERKARGLFDTMGFTTTRPEVSCHPEALLQGARTVVAAALSYYAPGPEPEPGEGCPPLLPCTIMAETNTSGCERLRACRRIPTRR